MSVCFLVFKFTSASQLKTESLSLLLQGSSPSSPTVTEVRDQMWWLRLSESVSREVRVWQIKSSQQENIVPSGFKKIAPPAGQYKRASKASMVKEAPLACLQILS